VFPFHFHREVYQEKLSPESVLYEIKEFDPIIDASTSINEIYRHTKKQISDKACRGKHLNKQVQ
jgi:hypothetical protein